MFALLDIKAATVPLLSLLLLTATALLLVILKFVQVTALVQVQILVHVVRDILVMFAKFQFVTMLLPTMPMLAREEALALVQILAFATQGILAQIAPKLHAMALLHPILVFVPHQAVALRQKRVCVKTGSQINATYQFAMQLLVTACKFVPITARALHQATVPAPLAMPVSNAISIYALVLLVHLHQCALVMEVAQVETSALVPWDTLAMTAPLPAATLFQVLWHLFVGVTEFVLRMTNVPAIALMQQGIGAVLVFAKLALPITMDHNATYCVVTAPLLAQVMVHALVLVPVVPVMPLLQLVIGLAYIAPLACPITMAHHATSIAQPL